MPRSVESTVISLIVRISVVLPAANGPVTTTLTAWPPRRRAACGCHLEPPHAGDEPQHQAAVDVGVALDDRRGVRVGGGGGRADDVAEPARRRGRSGLHVHRTGGRRGAPCSSKSACRRGRNGSGRGGTTSLRHVGAAEHDRRADPAGPADAVASSRSPSSSEVVGSSARSGDRVHRLRRPRRSRRASASAGPDRLCRSPATGAAGALGRRPAPGRARTAQPSSGASSRWRRTHDGDVVVGLRASSARTSSRPRLTRAASVDTTAYWPLPVRSTSSVTRAAAVDQRQQRPLLAADLRVGGQHDRHREDGLRRRHDLRHRVPAGRGAPRRRPGRPRPTASRRRRRGWPRP